MNDQDLLARYPNSARHRWWGTMTCFAPDNGELLISGEAEYVGQAHEVTAHLLQFRVPGSITMLQIEMLPPDESEELNSPFFN